jgi:tripartite-type tricarboxylate transporter receptor subunit TctC
MAVIGTLVANQPSAAGWWTECTVASAQAITGTSTATHTIVYSNTFNREFQPSLPLACIVLNPFTATSAAASAYATLQNGTNDISAQQGGATGGIGIQKVILGTTAQQTNTSTGLISYSESGTLSLTFVNAGATATVTAGTRLLFVQVQGN